MKKDVFSEIWKIKEIVRAGKDDDATASSLTFFITFVASRRKQRLPVSINGLLSGSSRSQASPRTHREEERASLGGPSDARQEMLPHGDA
jgi:hypothetical protein